MNQRQPNSNFCFVCGKKNPFGLNMDFYQTAPGEVTANITLPEHFQSYPGVIHGGIVAAMLDEVSGRSHMNGDQARFMYTARLEVRYRKNVPVGQPLRLVGKAGKSRSRMATASGAIYNAEDELLAEADALLVDIPPETISTVDLDALGWKVYEDSPTGENK